MSNLLCEYRRRHNSNFIWAAVDGVCFFNKNKKPAAICTLTESIRSIAGCTHCSNNSSKFVCEFYGVGLNRKVMKLLTHDHINADIDLLKLALKIDPNYVPFIAKDQKNIESWLWSFFLQSSPFDRYHEFNVYVKKQDKKLPNVMKTVDQMIWAVRYRPDIYDLYYTKLYQPFLIGRHYLLHK